SALTRKTKLFSLPNPKLKDLRDRGKRRSGKLPADMSLWYKIRVPPGSDPGNLLAELRRLPQVEIAEFAPMPQPPPAVTPDFTSYQGYLDVAPGGLEARYSWIIPGGNATGITVYDVEYDWLQAHEDLTRAAGVTLLLNSGDSNAPPGYSSPNCPAPCNEINREHGTAVLGELIGNQDVKGVTGISWNANIGLAPTNTMNLGYNPANAILLASDAGSAGDVILIEQQAVVCGLAGSNFGPAEWISTVFQAIETAVANGLVVVEAAGNGNVDLDQAACGTTFDRNVRDSGAILVGAGRPPASGADRERETFSSYGHRVDVQGWGSRVMTTGYGSFYTNGAAPNDPIFWYRDTFGGTSSASPMVAGAAADVQGVALRRNGRPYTSLEMRALLVETGSPQTGNTAEHIGPRPNLRRANTDGTPPAAPSGLIIR
ncbi:MAG TPA: S8 family serine peptidase, partial [Nitrospiraceae bacterium]|nr:S8 family serine peptidase [Nitrospiraceae bacterium]